MHNIHSGCGAALLITVALSATVSCGDADRTYHGTARNAGSGGAAGTAGKGAANSGGAHAAGASNGSSVPATTSAGNGAFTPGAGGSAPGTGFPSTGTAGFSAGTGDPSLGAAGSSPSTGGPPGAAGSSTGAAGSSTGAAGSPGAGGGAPTCTSQEHLCLGSCVSNSSVDHCGGSCDPCQAPAGGTATCDGNQCGFSCGSMKKCGSKCVPSNGCCSNNDCPAQNGMARQCDTSSNTCTVSGCASGFKPCGNSCIANNTCCSSNDCSGTCQTCSGPGGSCVAVKSADDPDSCAGTCDSSGTCKSKRGQSCKTVSAGCIGDSPCVDNYCCDSLCSGQCQACDIQNKQGMCSPVPSGSPHGNRTKCTTDGSNCGGKCTGKSDGTCDYTKDSCGMASCVKNPTTNQMNMSQAAGKCNAGVCDPADAKECKGYLLCSNNQCIGSCTKDGDCISGYECNTSTGNCNPTPKTITVYMDASLSGTVTSKDGYISGKFMAGDDKANTDICAFASFDTSSIAKGSVIETAALRIYRTGKEGDPYGTLGNLTAQKLKKVYTKLDVASLVDEGGEDRTMDAGGTNVQKEANVTSIVSDARNAGQTTIQFRFCFPRPPKENDAADSATYAVSGSNRPHILIEYHQ
ncbi:MAG TPA: hypothetical protein VFK05_33540 [Polyangiaceae bacterium]|nr:hypothetical protein [Polyangiaceae bacterium]